MRVPFVYQETGKMQDQILKKFLEKERKDCLKLKKKNDLTKEGEGMLLMIENIFQKMGWKWK